MELTTHKGSCHCGAVTFEVTTSLDKTMSCNCSMCGRAGGILSFAPADQFTLLSGEDSLTEYQFNKKVISHLFCKVCGVKPFSRGTDAEGNETVAVNVRCLDGINVHDLEPHKFDGRDV